jgi:hypothetical protein
MFVRFRQNARRLQVSLVETRRAGGKVKHEHIASLGSIKLPLSIADRIAFWQRLHERLARLSNRIDPATILGAIHAKVPMVTPQEQHQLKLENAQADERYWSFLHDSHEDVVADHKRLVGNAEAKIAEGQKAAAMAQTNATEAKARVERLERGEDVPGGLGEPVELERQLRDAGFTTRDLNHMRLLAKVCDLVGDDRVIGYMTKASIKASEREGRAALRRIALALQLGAFNDADDAGAGNADDQ